MHYTVQKRAIFTDTPGSPSVSIGGVKYKVVVARELLQLTPVVEWLQLPPDLFSRVSSKQSI
jgi:hypothetical protein